MLKGLIPCVLIFTLVVRDNLFAQTILPEWKVDSAQQLPSKDITEQLVEMKINTISKKQEVIVKAKEWRAQVVRSSISLYRDKKRIFPDYALSKKLIGRSDTKTISFSDPTKCLQKIAHENQMFLDNELSSFNYKNELSKISNLSSVEETYLKHIFNGQPEQKLMLNWIQTSDDIEHQLKKPQDNFLNVQNLSQQAGKLNENISGLRQIYSDKMLKRIYDSIGSNKIDSLVRIVSQLSKKRMTEDELLDAINNSFPEYHNPFSDTTYLSSLRNDRFTSHFKELQKQDLTKLVLSDSVIQSLPKMNSDRVKSQYLKAIDSIRSMKMKYQGFTLSENPISENIKASMISQKQQVWDRLYFDGVLGVLQDGKGTILKVSPSLGYNISNLLSLGLGPSILLTKDDQKWNGKVGLRSFLKGEVWRQRIYVQLEDNIDPVEINIENMPQTSHSILVGSGCLFPISNTLAINPSVFYRVNHGDTQFADASPWVFRMGISSITKPKR